ncbi:universal stress protein [Limibacter armeniacum]|uniref:universal stress protein n=1 Tax=Limibacter armeniacum TaxID=466084 RepID=UPI002FE548D3
MKLKRILVPTDFSEEANNALDVAVEIADIANAEISLLHVVDVPSVTHYDSVTAIGGVDESPELYNVYTGSLQKVVEAKMKQISEQYPNVLIHEHIVFDSLQRHIASFVTKDETDLIVMGSSGIHGIDELFIGSNTEKVIRLAKAPVLTIKQKEDSFYPREMVFASTFDKVSDKTALSLKVFQELFNATLHLVKVITPNTFEATTYTIETIEEFAKKYGFENYKIHTFNFFSEEEGIRVFADQINADMIAMSTHGRKGISHMLLGSIAEEVANHSHKSVLTFNEHYK